MIRPRRKIRLFLFAVCVFFYASAGGAQAERLPVKNFSSAEGLASSAITHVARDSEGFLWFCTRDGLSRFDGVEFVNYRLPNPQASQTFRYFLETSDGAIWIATNDGFYCTKRTAVSEIKPEPQNRLGINERILNAQKFYGANSGILYEDEKGRLWGGGGKSCANRPAETPYFAFLKSPPTADELRRKKRQVKQ
jgi:Predicted periplasmic ligand-binding sensor domain